MRSDLIVLGRTRTPGRPSAGSTGEQSTSPPRTDVRIVTELPAAMKARAAGIYYGEFRQKYDGLLLIPRSREQALRILTESMDWSMGIYALDGRGELVGLAGLGCRGRGFVKYRWKLLLREFGLPGSVRRKVIKFFEAPALRTDQVRVEGVVVSKEAQGKGIGTALMDAVTGWAEERGYASVRLEVINTNPRARRLYQRLGFVDTKRSYYGMLSRPAGFTWTWHMEKILAQKAGVITQREGVKR